MPADYVKVAFNVSSLERPQRPPPCGRCSSPSRECSSPSRRNYEITASSGNLSSYENSLPSFLLFIRVPTPSRAERIFYMLRAVVRAAAIDSAARAPAEPAMELETSRMASSIRFPSAPALAALAVRMQGDRVRCCQMNIGFRV